MRKSSQKIHGLEEFLLERIMELTATDTDSAKGFAGVDSLTGFGRIDAGAALELVKKPYRKLKHFGTDASFPFVLTDTLIQSN